MADELWVAQLGRIPYAEALALQEEVRARRQRAEIPDALLLLEHPPVYTRGRRGEGSGAPLRRRWHPPVYTRGRRTLPADLPMGEDWYVMQGIEVHDVD